MHGRSLRLDIHAFAGGQEFNIEIQRVEGDASERRARYHSSLMDAGCLHPGEDYADLPESYVIFITETDVLGRGAPIYFIERTIRGSQDIFNDGSHIVYVNSAINDTDTALGMERGMERGREEGRESERVFSIRSMMQSLGLSPEKAMDVLSIPPAERGRYRAML